MKLTSFYPILLIILVTSISGCSKLALEETSKKSIASFDNSSTTKIINELIQVDIDTYHAYMHAAKELKKGKICNLLKSFAADHEKNVKALSKIIIDLGGHPPSFSRDFKGFLTSGYVAIKVAGGARSTLDAMETNELISSRYYNKALSTSMPMYIKDIIRENLNNEQRHLESIKQMQRQLTNKR